MQIPWLFPIFIFSLTFNKIPWLFPSLEFPWLFPDRWTPCRFLAIGIILNSNSWATTYEKRINQHSINWIFLQYQFVIRQQAITWANVNPLHAKFFRVNINIYLYFVSFLHTNKTQVAEIPPRVRQGPAYSTLSISWLLSLGDARSRGISNHDIDLVKPS